MTAVDLFYDDLDESASDFTEASTQLQFDASRFPGDDPGVDAPIGRYQLQAEMNRGMDLLHDVAAMHGDAGSALGKALFAIAADYSELDEELSGEGNP